jgi:divalent metal cation (Fe/Co/Zn/Cd) transporter
LLSDILTWLTVQNAAQRPCRDHPYIDRRFETVVYLVMGGLLALMAIGIAQRAGHSLVAPGELFQAPRVKLYAASASILINEWL